MVHSCTESLCLQSSDSSGPCELEGGAWPTLSTNYRQRGDDQCHAFISDWSSVLNVIRVLSGYIILRRRYRCFFQTLKAKSGFLDVDRIDNTLWPLLSDDLDSGENSIILSAFGNHLTLIAFQIPSI